MRLESLVPLIGAQLVSTPEIHTFNDIVVKATKVQRGDLYLALNATQLEIHTAIENGAYGIIYDLPLVITDDEIAWLKVESVQEAEYKLLRFHLMQKELHVFYASAMTVAYIKMLKSSNDLMIIDNKLHLNSQKLWNIKEGQTIVVKQQDDVASIFPMAEAIGEIRDTISIYPVTPFESDLTVDYHRYKRLKIPRAFALDFSLALTFLQDKKLTFNLSNINFPPFYDIVSCDKSLTIKEFGQGVKTLVFLPSTDYLEKTVQSIKELTPWIEYAIFVHENEKDLGYNTFIYKDTQSCIQSLQDQTFDYAVVIGESKMLLEHVKRPSQPSLF